MKKNSGKKIVILLLILFYIMTGFFREFIFLNINEQSRVTYYHETDSHVALSMQWLSGLSYATLYYSKWALTLFFTAVFTFLATIIIRLWFDDKKLVKFTWITYSIAFVLGLLFYLAGYLTGDIANTYDIARFLAGLTETPAMLVILLASFMAMRRISQN
jgi:hypothetical protein